MGKSAGKGPVLSRVGRRAGKAASTARTRSFPCPDDLWDEVESFATEHELGSPAAAARLLLRSGLSVERRVRELKAARDWQIEQAADRARLRIRERKAIAKRAAVDA